LVKGKPWTVEEEKQLRILLQENKSVRAIAKAMGKTRESVRMKLARLEVVVQGEKNMRSTSTSASLVLPAELPSIEEKLKVLAGALTASCKPGLDETEVYRLQVCAELAMVYRDLAVGYRYYLSGQNNWRRGL
jgi:hypothetical protein